MEKKGNTPIAKSTDHRFDQLGNQTSVKELGYYDFPIRSRLSFEPILEHWRKKQHSENPGEKILALEISERLKTLSFFLEPIEDYRILQEHWDYVELMLTGLLPLNERGTQVAQASKPFYPLGFYQTTSFSQMLNGEEVALKIDKTPELARKINIIRACIRILNTFYGQNIELDLPVIYTVKPKIGGTERHFKTEFNLNFVSIKKTKPLLPLSQKQINHLFSDLYNETLWLKYFPPERFEFQGISVARMVDVTTSEALSRLKQELLSKQAVLSPDNILKMENHLRSYFKLSDLVMGITAVDYPVKTAYTDNYGINHHFLVQQEKNLFRGIYNGSIYEQACISKQTVLIDDLKERQAPNPLHQMLLDKGLRNILVVPLEDRKNNVVGLLEIGSQHPFDLTPFTVFKLPEILPFFRTALLRSRREIENEVDAIIRENYTALHPSVEWKFIRNALNYRTRKNKSGNNKEIDPIIFKNVYPLFGQADIVGSTKVSNKAIREDLLANLDAAASLLLNTQLQLALPLVSQYLLKIDRERVSIHDDITPDDEVRIVTFLKREILPFLEELKYSQPTWTEEIQKYYQSLHPDHRIIYDKRAAYERSVMELNQMITSYLYGQQKVAQDILPHYYEQYKTDGVQYDMLVGQSLLKKGTFRNVHLRNLRLWQLLTFCDLTQKIQKIQEKLEVKLETAQLILIYSDTISMRFRLDEKRFDVEGTYDIRYPIIKKRIDKALVKNTGERLTQAGHIAIVYAQLREREEYRGYLDFINDKGYIEGAIEDLELEDMQGVHGLRALRIKIAVKY